MATDPHPMCRFPDPERQLLLSQAGVGERVVARLESVGIGSLAELRHFGAEVVVLKVCTAGGGSGWTNRRRALTRVLSAATQLESDNAFRLRPAAAAVWPKAPHGSFLEF